MFDNDKQKKYFDDLIDYITTHNHENIATAYLINEEYHNNFIWQIKNESDVDYFGRLFSSVDQLDVIYAYSYIPRCPKDNKDYITMFIRKPSPEIIKIWERNSSVVNKEWKISTKEI